MNRRGKADHGGPTRRLQRAIKDRLFFFRILSDKTGFHTRPVSLFLLFSLILFPFFFFSSFSSLPRRASFPLLLSRDKVSPANDPAIAHFIAPPRLKIVHCLLNINNFPQASVLNQPPRPSYFPCWLSL